ncbi:MAG: hypothetical protein HZB33_05825 [Nitrospirae bacterium]|nr:hypothetical protein [Nitrospirota bacterium]
MKNTLIGFSGSPRLLGALIIALCSTYIYCSFGEKPFESWSHVIFYTPAGIALYAGIILNLSISSVRRAVSGFKPVEGTKETVLAMDSSTVQSDISFDSAAAWMASKGFRAVRNKNTLSGGRGRLSFVPGAILKSGLALGMSAILMSAHVRRVDNAVFHQGETKTVLGSCLMISEIKADVPDEFLSVGEGSNFALKSVEAKAAESPSSGGEATAKPFTITGGYPKKSGGAYWRIVNLGVTQEMDLDSGRGIRKIRTDLDLFPPGKTDKVSLEAGGPPITFTLLPEKTIKKGLVTGKLYDLKAPRYKLVIEEDQGRRKTEAQVKAGERLRLEKYDIVPAGRSVFVTVQAVRDPALVFIYIGLALTLAGACLMTTRFFWYEKRLTAVFEGGICYIGYTEEYFKKWGILKFDRWKKDLTQG